MSNRVGWRLEVLGLLVGVVFGSCHSEDSPGSAGVAGGGAAGTGNAATGGDDDEQGGSPGGAAGTSSEGGRPSSEGGTGPTHGGDAPDVGGAGASPPANGGAPGEAGSGGDGGACSNCSARIAELALGAVHSCARFRDGSVKCWGANNSGECGNADPASIGDDELPSSIGPVSITTEPGVTAVSIAAGGTHTCAILSNDTLKCWGFNNSGQLGLGTQRDIGDDEPPSDVGPLELSKTAGVKPLQVVAGAYHTCALLSDDSVKCWGNNTSGELGYPGVALIGSLDVPADWPGVSLTKKPGIKVTQLSAGHVHTCALFSDHSVTCWGQNSRGQLGYGNKNNIGDNEDPSTAGSVSVTTDAGVYVTALSAHGMHTCALLSDQTMKCWGRGSDGALGYGNKNDIGDNELPSSVGAVAVSRDSSLNIAQVSTGSPHTCARLSNGSIKCWGDSENGELGYGNTAIIGDTELPSTVDAVSLSKKPGVTAKLLATGWNHNCAVLSDESLVCWGYGATGCLGDGAIPPVGDDELPSSIPPVALF